MTIKPQLRIHVTPARKRFDLPEYSDTLTCATHPEAPPLRNLWGSAGGGVGKYTACRRCGKVISKTEDAP